MSHATLLILNGPNRGVRYELSPDDRNIVIGRSVGTRIRVDDTEVSRQHARIAFDGQNFSLHDLGSANGTYVNGHVRSETILRSGDTIRVGTTRLTFQFVGDEQLSVSAAQVHFIDDSPSGQHSAIVQQVQAEPTSSVTSMPERSIGLELLYQVVEELVRPVDGLETLLQRILDLTLDAVRADRGCVLLKDAAGDLAPVVFRRRGAPPAPKEQMPVSRSITGYVLQHGKAVRTSDALHDTRFAGGQSILSSGIREAICAPMRGQEELVGVLYLDITSEANVAGLTSAGRLNDEHLKSVLTVARQTALAVDARRFQDAMLKAERFAAMGQAVAVLSHHVKNILQGIGGAGYLIRTGLDNSQDDLIRQGWGIVERNQKRIYDLVMDMLSFSKERIPDLQNGSINDVCAEVAELAQGSADENGVRFEYRSDQSVPIAEYDHEGIHRAVLNIVLNAIDAVAESEDGHVVLQTAFDQANDTMLVAVTDNGPGIPEDQRDAVFNVFESSKGSRGTGIGLPVSRKILTEHGGRIRIDGGPGEGTRFVLSWPRGNPKSEDAALDRATQVPGPNGEQR